MNKSLKTQILEAEDRLRMAMLSSDVETLNELLAPELIFTNHLGQVLRKQDDLVAHQSGTIKISELTASEQELRVCGEVGLVSVRVNLVGSYAGITSDSDLRFTRIWTMSSSGTWQVVAAHSSIVA